VAAPATTRDTDLGGAVSHLTLRAGGRDVPLVAGPNALDGLATALAQIGFQGRVFVVADECAFELHGKRIRQHVQEAGLLLISGAEADKNLEQLERVWDWLVDERAERRDALLAFGGGVVCDLVGFAAATYLRGIGLINVPTTLLAQVDASVGGKTGINHPLGKNLIGAFYQPLCVVADTSLLSTLPPRAFASGMAEVAKLGMIMDGDLFGRLEDQVDALEPTAAQALGPIVSRSIELKAGVVERDERETGERMLLNYGHTVGHALEAAAGYGSLLHGEAVAVGMQAAARIAHRVGMLDASSVERQRRLLEQLGLRLRAPDVTPDEVMARLALDKKRAGQTQRWVLCDGVGSGYVRDDVPPEVAREAIESVTGT
jgi:3-dehydroquinate synthase